MPTDTTQRPVNKNRGKHIAKALVIAGYEGATDWAATVTDALTDLRHLCDTHGLCLSDLDRVAHDHYLAERHASDVEAQDSERQFTATEEASTQALKALWRAHPRLSACVPLAGKLAALAAAKAGASPIAASYVAQGYRLPEGLDWPTVEARRAEYRHPACTVPLVHTAGRDRFSGCTAWGTPMIDGAYLLHPGNIA